MAIVLRLFDRLARTQGSALRQDAGCKSDKFLRRAALKEADGRQVITSLKNKLILFSTNFLVLKIEKEKTSLHNANVLNFHAKRFRYTKKAYYVLIISISPY